MKIEEIKKYIEEHKEEFQLSSNDLVYHANDEIEKDGKSVFSSKYKDSRYSIYKFYKPISRFK